MKTFPKRINLVLGAVLLGGLLSGLTYSKNYYVSNNGNNHNTGLSKSEAFNSINRAVEMTQPGDTVFVMPGKYSEVITVSDKIGEPEKPVCILGYSKSKNDYPIIDGGAKRPSNNAAFEWMYIKNSSWIVIGRMKFINGWTYPIIVENSSYLTFDNCRFFGGKRVVSATGLLTHHLLIENSYWDQGGDFLWKVKKDSLGNPAWLSMHHLAMGYFNGSLIDFHGTGGSVVIRDNTIINAYNAIRWRGVKGYDSNIEIYGNHISRCRDNDFEPEYYTYNLFIYHNFSHNIHRTLSVDNVEGGDIYYFGNVITTDDNAWTRTVCTSFGKIYAGERKPSLPLYVFNNSFYGVAQAYKTDGGLTSYLHHNNNAYYFVLDNGFIINTWDGTDEFNYDISNLKWPANIIKHKQEQNGKVCNIMYAKPGKGDLRLRKDSPGIDAGKVMSFKQFGWMQSFAGNAPDIGAYENGKLMKGPAFRFIIPPGGNVPYKEKPRIVRSNINGKELTVYFSAEINPSTLKKNNVLLFLNNKPAEIKSLSFGKDNYKVNIKTGRELAGAKISISFKRMPYGINGEQATYWASAIGIHK